MKIFKILYNAFKSTKNLYTSFVGESSLKSNILDKKNSEFHNQHWNVMKVFKLLSDILFIKLPISAPSWIPKPIKTIFFGENSKYIPNHTELDSSGNCFIYVNGIMSNLEVVKMNKGELETMVNRPINIIYNVTDSLVMDLIECFIGRETEHLTEASTIALYTICNKLLDCSIEKVIIICHSQGTIIIAKVVQCLSKMGFDKEKYLKKLEIYAFASCAANMTYIVDKLPYMEHFANDNDFVAKLGCNCPIESKPYIKIDGEIFITKNKSGHLLNSHYLDNFQSDYPKSKLNEYMGGDSFYLPLTLKVD